MAEGKGVLEIAVVGHTNAGKTSLLRTLTRRIDFGEVSDRPGTTRHVEAVELRMAGTPALRFLDTPGLEDATGLLALLQAQTAGLPRGQRIAAFLASPEATADYEQEAKVLRCLLTADAALLVIDAREPPLPKFAAEIEILMLCAKPLMPVLNQVRQTDSREAAWRELLAHHSLHASMSFDAVAPFEGAERQLYADLGALLPRRRQRLHDLIEHLELERASLRLGSERLLAQLLLTLAAQLDKPLARDMEDRNARLVWAGAFRQRVMAVYRQGLRELLQLHGFDPALLREALPELGERWGDELFDPRLIARAGARLGRGAAIGAAVGVAADVMLAGLSLGAATAIGAAIGGTLSQAGGPLGERLMDKLRGRVSLRLSDEALLLLLTQLLALLDALERRGHAALNELTLEADSARREWMQTLDSAALAEALARMNEARGEDDWARPRELAGRALQRRDAVASRLAGLLRRLLPRRG